MESSSLQQMSNATMVRPSLSRFQLVREPRPIQPQPHQHTEPRNQTQIQPASSSNDVLKRQIIELEGKVGSLKKLVPAHLLTDADIFSESEDANK